MRSRRQIRALAFARSLLRRHGRRRGTASSVERRLLSPPRLRWSLERHNHLHAAPRTSVMLRPLIALPGGRRGPRGHPGTPGRGSRLQLRAGERSETVCGRELERVLRDVERRHERVEVTRPVVRVVHEHAGAGGSAPVVPVPPRELAGPARAAATQPGAAAAAPAAGPISATAAEPSENGAPFHAHAGVNGEGPAGAQAEQPLDVVDLTDRVLRAIDDRIVAERERLGR